MKLLPFTQALCQELLNDGYLYFLIQNQQDKDGLFNPQTAFTYKPVRSDLDCNKSVLISKVMDIDQEISARYSILSND